MSDSIRDQLLGLGFKAAPRPERKPDEARGKPRPPQASGPRKPEQRRSEPQRTGSQRAEPSRKRGEMDLAKAYAIRAQKEKAERIAAEEERQREAQRRREARVKLTELLQTASLNVADAELVRHFEYGGKIRRVYVTAEQLRALNAGDLAVVQNGGRYHVVSLEHATQVEALLPSVVALRVDPNAPASEDQYADPKYQVPDDLVW